MASTLERRSSLGVRATLAGFAFSTSLLLMGGGEAKAAQVGSLSFTDGTSNWAPQFLSGGVPFLPATFDVTFDPAGFASVFGADGLFLPDFTEVPPADPYLTGTNRPTVTFGFEASEPGNAFYSLNEDLVFTFNGPASAGTVTIYEGTVFAGTADATFTNVQFDLDVAKTLDLNPATPSPTFVGLTNDPVVVTGGAFTFNDTTGPGLGSYSANVDIAKPHSKVPAPLPIFGAAVAFGYTRKVRARIRQFS